MLIAGLPGDSATALAIHGETALWGVSEHLLAGVIDVLQVANWQRSGGKGGKRPKPIPRPTDAEPQRIGKTTRPAAQVKALLRRMAGREEPPSQ